MARDALGRRLMRGQMIIMKNVETLPFIIEDVSEITQVTQMGPMDTITIKVRAEFPIRSLGDAPLQLYIIKEPEQEKSKLVV
jgi:hypothetical protein